MSPAVGDPVVALEDLGSLYSDHVRAGTAGVVAAVHDTVLSIDFETMFGLVRIDEVAASSLGSPAAVVAPPAPQTAIPDTREPVEKRDRSEVESRPRVGSTSADTQRSRSERIPSQSESPTVSQPAPDPRSTPAAPRSTRGGSLEGVKRAGSGLIPFVVFRMFCSLRQEIGVNTSLPPDELRRLFAQTLTAPKGITRFARGSTSGYLGRARWRISGLDAAGACVATCDPTGLAVHSLGKAKAWLDISGDTIELQAAGIGDGPVLVGPGTFTTRWGFFAFPEMHLIIRSFLRAVRKADPQVRFQWPWSRVRMTIWAALLVLLLVLGVSGGCSSSSSSSYSSSSYGSSTYGSSSSDSSSTSSGSSSYGNGSSSSTYSGSSDSSRSSGTLGSSGTDGSSSSTTSSPTDSTSSTDGSSSRGTTDGLVTIDDSSGPTTEVAHMFNDYFSGINNGSYQQTWQLLDSNAQDRQGSYNHFVDALSSSHDSNVHLVSASSNDDGTISAHLTFTSNQDADKGPQPGQTCSNWDLTYVLNTGSGSPVVDHSENVSFTAC